MEDTCTRFNKEIDELENLIEKYKEVEIMNQKIKKLQILKNKISIDSDGELK